MMKNNRTFLTRLLLIALLTALLFCLAAVTALSEDSYGRVHDPNAPRIVDNLNLLSDSFESSLLTQIRTMQSELQTDFVVVTTNDLSPYDVNYYGIQNYADDFYDYNGYGIGPDFNGTIFVIFISPDGQDRFYKFEFTGSEEIRRFASEIESIENDVAPILSSGNYERAVQTYFDLFERKHHWYSRISIFKIIICVGIASLIGLIYVSSLKKKMKTVLTAVGAKNYLVDGTYNLRTMNEVFVRSAVTRTARQKSSGSSGGGSHFGSSGVSHSGGGGRF